MAISAVASSRAWIESSVAWYSFSWQPRQRLPVWSLSRRVRFVACGSWQESQEPSANGLWTLPPPASRRVFISAWQVRQSSPDVLTRNFWFALPCGSWHLPHCPSRTGVWTAAFANAASAAAYTLDMTPGSGTLQQVASMANPRAFLNLTTLPDGNVLVSDSDGNRVIEVNRRKEVVWSYGDGSAPTLKQI